MCSRQMFRLYRESSSKGRNAFHLTYEKRVNSDGPEWSTKGKTVVEYD